MKDKPLEYVVEVVLLEDEKPIRKMGLKLSRLSDAKALHLKAARILVPDYTP